MRIEKNIRGWNVEPTTDTEEGFLDYLFTALQVVKQGQAAAKDSDQANYERLELSNSDAQS